MNAKVDLYLDDGCGRCDLYKTPQCKVHTWHNELVQLRKIVLNCGLTEEVKWGQPCYTFQGKESGKKPANVLIVCAFKGYSCISFFKGALMKDVHKMLVAPGENSQATRQLRFTSVDEIQKVEDLIKFYIYEAINIEKAGLKVEFKKADEQAMPKELSTIFKENPKFEKAFEALTPGRKRGYLMFFAAPKQSATRISRIQKSMPKIFEGKGVNDR